jgi:hypothetical protein
LEIILLITLQLTIQLTLMISVTQNYIQIQIIEILTNLIKISHKQCLRKTTCKIIIITIDNITITITIKIIIIRIIINTEITKITGINKIII